jgi:predicted O-linked N-acetylglucosamine transferase (SPINDLY family)
MATAILHSIGCGEFALESPEEYEQLAVALGRSAGRLADARRQVREGVAASSLFDPARTAADVEDACFSLWHAFCRTVRHEPENAPSLPDSPNARQSLP